MVINSASEIIFFDGFAALIPQGVTDKIYLNILLYFNRFMKITILFSFAKFIIRIEFS